MIAALVLVVLLAQLASPEPSPIATATALPDGAAVIFNSGSTNAAPYEIVVFPSGDATVVRSGVSARTHLAAPQTRWLFAKLARSAALDTFASARCMKSASFGTVTELVWNGHRSPDLSCPGSDPALREFARIADVIVVQLGVSVGRPRRRMPL